MQKPKNNEERRHRRHIRIRGRVEGTALRPRVALFRSLRSMSAQLIDDALGKTLAEAHLSQIKKAKNDLAGARAVGKLLGERIEKLKIKSVAFDRAGYKYHGRVKELAEGIREAGIAL